MSFSITAISITVLILFLTIGSSNAAPSAKDSGEDIYDMTYIRAEAKNAELLSSRGHLNMNAYLATLASCGSGSNLQLIYKVMAKIVNECELVQGDDSSDEGDLSQEKRVIEPYKLACGTACLSKKLGLITKDYAFLKDEEKVWKIATERLQFQRDEKTAKAVKGIASCGTIVPKYREANCYSSIPYALCFLFSLKKACLLPL